MSLHLVSQNTSRKGGKDLYFPTVTFLGPLLLAESYWKSILHLTN